MSKTTTKYIINQFKQIIPLNENIVNFELNFEIKSENSLPFKAVILSEDDLNSEKPINYQDVTNGIINGNIVNDKGVYQLYYLLLKADQPVDCNVTIDIKEVPINPEIQRLQQEEINTQRENMMNIQRQQQLEVERKNREIEQKKLREIQEKETERQEKGKQQLIKKVQEKEETKTNWFIIIGIIVAFGIGIWFMFFNKKKKNKNTNNIDGKIELVPPPPVIQKIADIETILQVETPKLQVEVPIELPKVEIPIEMPKIEVQVELPKVEVQMEIPKISSSRRNNNLLNRLNTYFDN